MDSKVSEKLDNFFMKFNHPHKYKKGEIIIQADEKPPAIFYLKEGVVRRYAISPNGEELILNIFKPISFFPVSFALNNTVSSHYFDAMTDTLVYQAAKDDVYKFLIDNPDVLLDLVSRVYRGLEGLFDRMEHLMGGGVQGRLITELLIFSRRFGHTTNNQSLIELKLTEKELAAQSGIARETVSRELGKLKTKGLIDFRKKSLTIVDVEGLEKELEAF